VAVVTGGEDNMDTTNTTDLFYYTQPVESADQALSLAEYLTRHGIIAHQDGTDQVIVPVSNPADTSVIYDLVKHWRLFWENTDSGVFSLPVYQKD
jgi:hypothetical protein